MGVPIFRRYLPLFWRNIVTVLHDLWKSEISFAKSYIWRKHTAGESKEIVDEINIALEVFKTSYSKQRRLRAIVGGWQECLFAHFSTSARNGVGLIKADRKGAMTRQNENFGFVCAYFQFELTCLHLEMEMNLTEVYESLREKVTFAPYLSLLCFFRLCSNWIESRNS